jgi:hypothetical protein
MKDNQLKLGTAKIDITPAHALPLAGFKDRAGSFEGVDHRLYARIFYYEKESSAGRRSALLVTADLIWWGDDRVESLRSLLSERYGLDLSSIILHATHTHSGPQTSMRYTPSLGLMDAIYVRQLEEKLLAGVEVARSRLEPVSIHRGTGHCGFGIHRRKKVDGVIVMAPNESGPTDPEVSVVRFCGENGKTKAVLVHFTCHPTTTIDNRISSEFPGVAMELIERSLGGEAVAGYLQGCCGDIRPNLVRNDDFFRGSDADVRVLGTELAEVVLDVLKRPMRALKAASLISKRLHVPLRYRKLPDLDELNERSAGTGTLGEWSRLLLCEKDRLKESMLIELGLVELADGLSLLSMNGEVVVEYGLFVKEQFAGQVLPVAYSNGMIGYVPTARQAEEGGYEAKESHYYFGLPSPFHPSLEAAIRAGILKLRGDKRIHDNRTLQAGASRQSAGKSL